jgi:hypothetical protein
LSLFTDILLIGIDLLLKIFKYSTLNVFNDSNVLNYDEIASDSRFSYNRPIRFIETYMRSRAFRNPFLSSVRNPADPSISNITTNTRNLASFINTSQENNDPNDILNNLDEDSDSLNNSRFLNIEANNLSNISNAADLNIYRNPAYTINLSEETSEESDEASSSSSYILNNGNSVEITSSQNNLQLLNRRRTSLRELWQRRLEREVNQITTPSRIVDDELYYNRRNKKDFYIHTKVFLFY